MDLNRKQTTKREIVGGKGFRAHPKTTQTEGTERRQN
jgi:hypothetical protein